MKASRNVVYPAFRRSRRRGLRLDGLAGCTLAALIGVSLARPVAGQQPRRIQLDDFAAIVRVAEPQLSPDGKSVVCVVGRPNLKDDRYDSSLVLIDIASGTQRLLTQERKGVSSPRWSPSGDRVAFLAQASSCCSMAFLFGGSSAAT